jgi:glycerol-3-phosphate dehydrogenase
MMSLACDSPLLARPEWRRLLEEHHDLLVVGGGIHGAGVARDGVLRGLRVALIERDDWASGTSSRSSKLFHGGLRYLRQGAIGLVRESLRERDLARVLAPDLVRSVTFRIPGSPEGRVPLTARLGVGLYGLLSGSPRRARFWEPEPTYEDAMTDDARFCLRTVLDARRQGALALSYVEWLEWIRRGDRVIGARVRDRFTGKEGEVSASAFVNAAGPWGAVLAGGPARRAGAEIRLTRGTHVVLDRRVDDDARLFFSPVDGRVLFLLPYAGHASLLGTTELDESAPTKEPIPTAGEVRYLREAFRAQFPQWGHWRAVGVSCGIRPLLAGSGPPTDLSREERLLVDPSGNLVSILGGKYTTFRAVAERAVDRVERFLGREPSGHPTRREPLPGDPASVDSTGALRRAFAEEDAVRLEDVFLRRTHLGHLGPIDPNLMKRVLHLWRLRWGKSDRDAEAELEAFQNLQERRLAPLTAW